MNALDAYLEQYYLTPAQLAAICSISSDELASLVSEGLVPQPSYIITGDTLVSQAFGEFQVKGSTPGQYFHPGNAKWVVLAMQLKGELGVEQARDGLKRRFKNNFAVALGEMDKTIFRLSDSFTDAGTTIPEGLAARTESAWDAFQKGIFSLCVADPSSERSIVRKEVLQEALTSLSANGAKRGFSAADRQQAREYIEQYAQAAMPFSPLEYPRSSRKRLVEEFAVILDAV